MANDFLKPETLLFVRKSLEASDIQGLAGPLNLPGDLDLRAANISVLLPLLHDAREKDEKAFWISLFLPWITIQGSVGAHHQRITDEFAKIVDFSEGSTAFAIHLVNLYRSIVSELLDPYLTLPLACFQLIEGTFTTIQDSNVGLKERNKAEYIESRTKRIDPENRLLSGYNPIVRNAVTHAGSDGVTYSANTVLFRNIKRGIPQVVDTVEWSHDTLTGKIVRLYECIISIDAAVNIFGVDCGEILLKDADVKAEVIQRVFTPQQRTELRGRFDDLVEQIRNDKEITANQQFDLLSQMLIHNYAQRNMPIRGIRISSENHMVMVEIPDHQKDLSNDEVLRDAVLECSHYCILARTVFGSNFERYVVRTILESGQSRLTVILAGKLLQQYVEEQAGLYDLLHESDVRLDGNRVVISIDFEMLSELEKKHLDRRFPRKSRPGIL
ncbi:MAG TPA: hypothetical protein VFQ41_06705 [Candidatus Angelobacter sp.]|nr:hypothetical protein [Candidatus Angelobacter sp.]